MTQPLDPIRLHAYVDGELAAADVIAIERALAADPVAAAEVAALVAQKNAMHARFDPLLSAPHGLSFGRPDRSPHRSPFSWGFGASMSSRAWAGAALAATLMLGLGVGLGAGWVARGHADRPDALATRAGAMSGEARFGDFVHVAAISHAIYTPEVRHPVEVPAADEAHLVAWLSKRLDAPLVVPHLGDAGWTLLGGRLLPARVGPVAQFMYQDGRGRRLTLAVSHAKGDASKQPAKPGRGDPATAERRDTAVPTSAFRIAEDSGNTVFYWIDADYAYALTGKLARAEMTELASRVYRQLDR